MFASTTVLTLCLHEREAPEILDIKDPFPYAHGHCGSVHQPAVPCRVYFFLPSINIHFHCFLCVSSLILSSGHQEPGNNLPMDSFTGYNSRVGLVIEIPIILKPGRLRQEDQKSKANCWAKCRDPSSKNKNKKLFPKQKSNEGRRRRKKRKKGSWESQCPASLHPRVDAATFGWLALQSQGAGGASSGQGLLQPDLVSPPLGDVVLAYEFLGQGVRTVAFLGPQRRESGFWRNLSGVGEWERNATALQVFSQDFFCLGEEMSRGGGLGEDQGPGISSSSWEQRRLCTFSSPKLNSAQTSSTRCWGNKPEPSVLPLNYIPSPERNSFQKEQAC